MHSPIVIPQTAAIALKRLEQAGFEGWVVGGCVRDALLSRAPNDWDITTSARPEDVLSIFSDCRVIETGVKHGTVTVLIDGEPLEITTYRADGEYADNRHPVKVTFSDTVTDDLSRRDFTVNAMAYHPTRGIVDLFGGQADLTAKKIACVGDPSTRFHEDGLRILRAIRFASVLDFSIEQSTADAIHACRTLLSNIAVERIREEFCKLISGSGAVRILREYSDVIAEFLPELGACVGFSQNTKYHCYDVYEHSIRALEYTATTDSVTRLAILLHDIGKPRSYTEDETGGHFKGHGRVGTEMTFEALRRLRFDNATVNAVTQLVEYHDREIPAEERAVKRLMQKMSDENILRLMEVKRCDRLAHAPEFSTPSPAVTEIPRILGALREKNACISLATLKINGKDLIGMGIPAGRELGKILQMLLDEVIEQDLPNERDTLLDAARNIVKKA